MTTYYNKASLHRWASLHSELLWIYDGPVRAGAREERLDHSTGYWAWLVRKGLVQIKTDRQTLQARAGQWLISPQGVVTQSFPVADTHILSVHFQCRWPTGENLFTEPAGFTVNSAAMPKLARTATALCRLVHRHFPEVALDFSTQAVDYDVFLRFQKLFLQWLADFNSLWQSQSRTLAKASEGDTRLVAAIKLLHETPLGDEFPAEILHEKTGLGRPYLDRLFWKEYQISTREYWERLRKEAAIRLLQLDKSSVKEIGYQLGFKQASHFTKWFTRRAGLSPKAYREKGVGTWIY